MPTNLYLQYCRMEIGKTQQALSKELGFGPNYVSLVEHGASRGSIKFWEKAQRKFGIPDEEMWDAINGKMPRR